MRSLVFLGLFVDRPDGDANLQDHFTALIYMMYIQAQAKPKPLRLDGKEMTDIRPIFLGLHVPESLICTFGKVQTPRGTVRSVGLSIRAR